MLIRKLPEQKKKAWSALKKGLNSSLSFDNGTVPTCTKALHHQSMNFADRVVVSLQNCISLCDCMRLASYPVESKKASCSSGCVVEYVCDQRMV